MIKKLFRHLWKSLKDPNALDNSSRETDEKTTLMVFLVVLFFVVLTISFESIWTDQLTAFFKKSKNTPFINKLSSACVKNDSYDKCVKAQQAGKGCVWYGACNTCGESGQAEKEFCESYNKKTPPSKSTNTKSSPEPTRIIEQNKNCESMNGKYEECINSQAMGSSCVWQAGCNKCADKNMSEAQVCSK